MTMCQECVKLRAEVESLTRYIKSHQESGLRWLKEVRELRKQLEALKGEPPKKKRKPRLVEVNLP